jgi:hypothetical protein
MYLFCNSRIHVITLYSVHVCVYYASMLRCWHLVWILIRTDHPCLGVGCHTMTLSSLHVEVLIGKQGRRALNQPWTPLLSMGVSARTRPRRWLGHGTLNPPLCARLCFLPPLARGGGELSNVPAMYAMDSSLGAPRAPRPLPQGCTARPWGSVVAQHVGGVVVAMRQLLVLHDRLVIHAAEVVHGGCGLMMGARDCKIWKLSSVEMVVAPEAVSTLRVAGIRVQGVMAPRTAGDPCCFHTEHMNICCT